MARRVSDEIAAKIVRAIEELPILEVIKEKIRWEAVPILNLQPGSNTNLMFMAGLGLPVPGTEDYIMPFLPLQDDAYEEIARLVGTLYEQAQKDVDEEYAARAVALNGHRKTAGGLIIPS